jgi:acyl transferase domain-containing protein
MRSQLVDYLNESLRSGRPPRLDDVAYTLNLGRDHFEYRLACIAEDLQQLARGLTAEDIDSLRPVTLRRNSALLPELDFRPSDYRDVLRHWQQRYLEGVDIEWDRLHRDDGGQRLHLPAYCFDTSPYWFESAADSDLMKLARPAVIYYTNEGTKCV